MITQIDIIFEGKLPGVDMYLLIRTLLNNISDEREPYFNEPEDSSVTTHSDIIGVFESEELIDFVVSFDELNIFGISIPNIFSQTFVQGKEVELLLFFDFSDLDFRDGRTSIDNLRIWTTKFQEAFKFEYFRCQIDNGNADQYYFDSHGLGPWYHLLDT